MTRLKVSVIIPCLNMEKYIRNCLESVLKQTMTEIEIIIIDAGSTDGTLDIAKRLAKEDSRIKIIHSIKKSYGYQVNLGIMHAIGAYIAIVDADDRVEARMYEMLYGNAIESKADYVKGTAKCFYQISEDKEYYYKLIQFPKDAYAEGKLGLKPMDRPDLLTKDNFLWYGIFKRELMKDIRLHESSGAAFQDLGGLLQTQMRAQNAVYLAESFYEYRRDNVSASEYNPKGFEFVWNEYSWAEKFIADAPSGWKSAFYRKMFLHILDRYHAMGASGQFWSGAETYLSLLQNKMEMILNRRVITEKIFMEEEREKLQLFLTDKYKIYKQYQDTYMNQRNQLSHILNVMKNNQCVLFGAGQYGFFLHAQAIKHRIDNVIAYCDNAADTPRSSIWNVPVLKPGETLQLYPNACYIVANKNHTDEMRRQLTEMGISDRQICCYTEGVDMHLFGENFKQ